MKAMICCLYAVILVGVVPNKSNAISFIKVALQLLLEQIINRMKEVDEVSNLETAPKVLGQSHHHHCYDCHHHYNIVVLPQGTQNSIFLHF
jgi:hypothetical protein